MNIEQWIVTGTVNWSWTVKKSEQWMKVEE